MSTRTRETSEVSSRDPLDCLAEDEPEQDVSRAGPSKRPILSPIKPSPPSTKKRRIESRSSAELSLPSSRGSRSPQKRANSTDPALPPEYLAPSSRELGSSPSSLPLIKGESMDIETDDVSEHAFMLPALASADTMPSPPTFAPQPKIGPTDLEPADPYPYPVASQESTLRPERVTKDGRAVAEEDIELVKQHETMGDNIVDFLRPDSPVSADHAVEIVKAEWEHDVEDEIEAEETIDILEEDVSGERASEQLINTTTTSLQFTTFPVTIEKESAMMDGDPAGESATDHAQVKAGESESVYMRTDGAQSNAKPESLEESNGLARVEIAASQALSPATPQTPSISEFVVQVDHASEGEAELDDQADGMADETLEVDTQPSSPLASSSILSRSASPSVTKLPIKPASKVKDQKKTSGKTGKEGKKAKSASRSLAKVIAKKGAAAAKKDKTKTGNSKSSSNFLPDTPTDTLETSGKSTPVPAEDDSDNDDAVYCVCRKPYRDEDEDVTMVACDGCDNWFHPACIGMDESKIDRLDVYICAKCETTTTMRTTWKQMCKREQCGKSLGATSSIPAQASSKYCSKKCAFQHMAAQVGPTTNKKILRKIISYFVGLPAPQPTFTTVDHSSDDSPDRNLRSAVDTSRIWSLQAQIAAVETALAVNAKRRAILQSAIARCETSVLSSIPVPNSEMQDKKSKKRSGGGDDRPCGWVPKLAFSDVDIQAYNAASSSGTEDEFEAEACMLPKRRCDRHQGWPKIMTASLDLEATQLVRRREDLEAQINEIDKARHKRHALLQAKLDLDAKLSKARIAIRVT